MKFTEGYWLRSERANASYAMHAYQIYALPDRLRVVSTEKIIRSRSDTLNVATITTDFYSVNENTVGVRSWHHEAYRSGEPRTPMHSYPCAVNIKEDENEAVMTAGNLIVRVDKKEWGFRFESEGKILTSCGFRNLGYIRYDRPPSTMFPGENYLRENGKPYMLTELSLRPDECVYGFGERFTAFVKNGQQIDIWNEDGGTSSQVAYKNIPFYLTNHNYGVFVEHTAPVSFEVASEKVEYVGFSVPGEEIRYNVICGNNPAEVLKTYANITGKPALPPAWSFGLWLSTSFTTDYDEKTVASFIDGMAEREIPLSVFHYDCFWMKPLHWCDFEWDSSIFPDIENMLKRIRERGLRISVWINPYVAQGSEFFAEGAEKSYFLTRADGKGVRQLDHWQPGMAIVDFTNPAAYEWYAGQIKKLIHIGIDSFKTDFGERIPVDVEYYNGADPLSMHNYYPYLYNKCVFEAIEEERGKGSAVVFARSAAAGCQQFPLHWGGDNSANYPSMAETLRGGLSFAMSGFSFWSHDIGGFEQTSSPDLFKRWLAFGLLSTHSRLHGSESYRVPWAFDDESCDVAKTFAKLKNRLMPYLYAMAVKASHTGLPVLRPMVLEFCGDPAVDYLDRQYMLGDSILVAPILNEEGRCDYYLPHGTWTHLLSGEVREGGRWHKDIYDYYSLPLYIRPNTLLALGANEQRPDYHYSDGVSLHLFALDNGNCAVCDIPNVKGESEAVVTAVREGARITFDLTAALAKSRIIPHGLIIKQVEYGTMQIDNGIACVIPEKDTLRVIITVEE